MSNPARHTNHPHSRRHFHRLWVSLLVSLAIVSVVGGAFLGGVVAGSKGTSVALASVVSKLGINLSNAPAPKPKTVAVTTPTPSCGVDTDAPYKITYQPDGSIGVKMTPGPSVDDAWFQRLGSPHPTIIQGSGGTYYRWTHSPNQKLALSFISYTLNGDCRFNPPANDSSESMFAVGEGNKKKLVPGTDLFFQLPKGATLLRIVLSSQPTDATAPN